MDQEFGQSMMGKSASMMSGAFAERFEGWGWHNGWEQKSCGDVFTQVDIGC